MSELSNQEKAVLGHEALGSFIEEFAPLNQWSVVFLEVLFEILMENNG